MKKNQNNIRSVRNTFMEKAQELALMLFKKTKRKIKVENKDD